METADRPRGHGEHGERPQREGALAEAPETLVDGVLTAATNVHRELGPGLFEPIYEAALCCELEFMGIAYERQLPVPVCYRGNDLGIGYRADVLVERCLLLELKAVEQILPKHVAQVISYLRLLRVKRGFLLNFHERLLKDGIKRVSI
jgi:GxxExxY protein